MEDTNFFTGIYSGTDDLLVDFPYVNDIVLNDSFFDNVITNSTDSSTVSGHISSGSFSDSQFSGVDLCLPVINTKLHHNLFFPFNLSF